MKTLLFLMVLCSAAMAYNEYPACVPHFKYGYTFEFTHPFYGECLGRIKDMNCDQARVIYSVFSKCEKNYRDTFAMDEDTILRVQKAK